jgi:hypothetical protein
MTNIEQFWKDYIAFEQNINPIIAEKMGMERSRDYMNARRVAKEFEAATRGVNRNAPSVPPTVATEEVKQVCLNVLSTVICANLQYVRWIYGKNTFRGRKVTP